MRRLGMFVIVFVLAFGCGKNLPSARFADLPAEFEVQGRAIATTTTFDLVAGGHKYGTVAQSMLSLTRSFTVEDTDGVVVARARSKFLSWGVHIDVIDGNGVKIGEIREDIVKSIFKVHTTYAILNSAGQTVAISKKEDWLATSMTLYNPAEAVIATLQRPAVNWFSDTWKVSIKDPNVVDPRVIVVMGAYKTAVDKDRAAEEEKKKDSERK